MLATLWKRIGRLLAIVASPMSKAGGAGGVAVLPYRGYGSRHEIFLMGRVFTRSDRVRMDGARGLRGLLRNVLRRLTSSGLPGASVCADFAGQEEHVVSDADGYFRVHMTLSHPPPADGSWQPVVLRLADPTVTTIGQVFIPPRSCRYVVISDIDDTVVQTGVGNFVLMLWRLFVQDARSRLAFPGVAALYQSLHRGRSGQEANPLLYVSRAPWGTYEVLEAFFQLHGIPIGPILFLREWGLTWHSPLPRRAAHHKEELIRHMLAVYDELPFVLIGDSGQHDPEVYRRIVEDHPHRVAAVFIRNVSRSARRVREIEGLAARIAESGSTLLLAQDSLEMAREAVRLGLVPADTPDKVAYERALAQEPAVSVPTQRLTRATRWQTEQAVAHGELGAMIPDQNAPQGANIIVEPRNEPNRAARRLATDRSTPGRAPD